MELKLLRAFVVLAEELHFGHAAGRLCIVQPALSMQLQKLERELGVTLFERDRHRVELTALGRTFLPEAQAILAQAERAVGLVKAADAGEVGTLRLGFVSSILPVYLPELIRRLRARYPAIELELKDMPSPEQLQALHSNRIDIGFVRLPIDDRRVTTQTVFTESFVVALPDDHPLAQAEAITPTALADIPVFFLARRFAPGYYDEVMRAFRRAGHALQIAREFGEFTTMAALISAGMGIGILPKYAMSAKYDNVAIRPLASPDLQARVGLAWTEPESRLEQAFLDIAGETAHALATTP